MPPFRLAINMRMTEIRFTRTFGGHQRGNVEDLPDIVAHKLIKVGVAELATMPQKSIEPTEHYTADKVVKQRVVRKAKDDGVQ